MTLAITGLQGRVHRWLSGGAPALESEPRAIVVLGGGGIPSESGLIRCWYAAQAGRTMTNALLVVCLPSDVDPETSSTGLMRDELVMRGIEPERILLEYRGRDTHEQAVFTAALLGDECLDDPILVVTSDYHMRRSLMSFRKAGFREVSGMAAFRVGVEADLGGKILLRYSFWQHLESQAFMARELCALAWYKLRGWL